MRTMHTHSPRVLVVILVMLAGTIVSADRVRLRSGKVIEGTFTGADSSTVRLLLANGSRADFPVGDVASIEITPRKPPPPPPPPPAPARAPAPITVPANTIVKVRLTDEVGVEET